MLNHLNESITRIDVVFDHYILGSIKSGTRAHRTATQGQRKPIRRKVESRDVPLPSNWSSFLSMEENKADLTDFLSQQLMDRAQTLPANQTVITAGGYKDPECASSSNGPDPDALQSSHEEADTRMILHAREASQQGYKRILVYSRDTDVMVLLVHFFKTISAPEIWMCAGTKQKPKYIPIHSIVGAIPDDICEVLPSFHAVTGCDTTSQFSGHSKKTAWKVFLKHPSLIADLGKEPLSEEYLTQAEKFVVLLYADRSKHTSVDDLRVELFRHKLPEALPPTQDALKQHLLRAHLQAFVWYQSCEAKPVTLSPDEYGWKLGEGEKPVPVWVTQRATPCTDLVCCKCKTGCKRVTCTCVKNALMCIKSCSCNGKGCKNPITDQEPDFDSD